MPLTQEEQHAIRQQVDGVEARTGAQVMAGVVGKCDAYPEVPWKAFALGAALGAVASLVAAWLRPAWPDGGLVLTAVVTSLGTGAGLALLTVFAIPVARLFVDAHRAEVEVRQYAEGLFLRQEVFKTQRRIGVLLMVSEFERQLLILPDTGIRARVSEGELAAIIATMRPPLVAGNAAAALRAGLAALEELLVVKGFTASGQNEIVESLVQEKGQ
jgi:putative membrane protein